MSKRTKIASQDDIVIELDSSRGTFSLIQIELKLTDNAP